MNPERPVAKTDRSHSRTLLWVGVATALAVGFLLEVFVVRLWVVKHLHSKAARSSAIQPNRDIKIGGSPAASNTMLEVSITLSAPIVENGIRLVQYSDGTSTPAVMANKECYRFMPKVGSHMYFAIDPSFKRAPPMHVEIEVEYFDAANGTLDVQYDSWNPAGFRAGRYTVTRQKATLNRSQQWRRAIFDLPQSCFESRQNGGADFRLRASKPEVYIRKLIARHIETTTIDGPYTHSNSVTLIFDQPPRSEGLRQVFASDSITAPDTVGDQSCIAVRLDPTDKGHVYFAIDDSFKRAADADYSIDVEYYSAGPCRFRLQYDGYGGQMPPAYTRVPEVNGVGGSWQKVTLKIPDPRFRNSQNGRADFRLQIFTPNFFLRAVTLRRERG